MGSPEIQEIRELFDRAERESDPRRKHAALEEALDLLDALSEDVDELSETDLSLVHNLRRSNTRRLLSQLVAARRVDFDVWFSYLSLLLFRLGPEVEALLKDDQAVRTAYDAFIGLAGPEAMETLENIRAKSKDGLWPARRFPPGQRTVQHCWRSDAVRQQCCSLAGLNSRPESFLI